MKKTFDNIWELFLDMKDSKNIGTIYNADSPPTVGWVCEDYSQSHDFKMWVITLSDLSYSCAFGDEESVTLVKDYISVHRLQTDVFLDKLKIDNLNKNIQNFKKLKVFA